MKFIIGKKIEMTQIWQKDRMVAVTKVLATPCQVVQVKAADKDGYKAVQIGYGKRKEKNIKKPQKGHFKNLGNFLILKEFRTDSAGFKRGDILGVAGFAVGDNVQVSGESKGKGFQGVVRRHGFSGSKKTHGNKDQSRMPGSIGAAGPAHVFKGTRMGGRMGKDKTTVKNLAIIEVDEKENILYVKGAIPGARNSYVFISGEGDMIVQNEKPASQDQSAGEGPAGTGEKTDEKSPEALKSGSAGAETVTDKEKK